MSWLSAINTPRRLRFRAIQVDLYSHCLKIAAGIKLASRLNESHARNRNSRESTQTFLRTYRG